MAKKIDYKRVILDNGFDYFFKDDKIYGWSSLEQAMVSLVNLSKLANTKTKLFLSTTYMDGSYKDKTIATFNPKNVPKNYS